MVEIYLLAVILLPSAVLAQVDGVQPDVSFTENNDRFDLTEMWADKKLEDVPLIDEGDSAEAGDNRRMLHVEEKDAKELSDDILQEKNSVNEYLTRRGNKGFAFVDDTDNAEGGTMTDFEENLKHFQVNVKPPRRNDARSKNYRKNNHPNSDDKVLLEHAVPITFKVDGYLKVPLD